MTTSLTLGPIGQIARGVRDIAAAQLWYADILGLTPLFAFGKMRFLPAASSGYWCRKTMTPTHRSCISRR